MLSEIKKGRPITYLRDEVQWKHVPHIEPSLEAIIASHLEYAAAEMSPKFENGLALLLWVLLERLAALGEKIGQSSRT